MLCLLQCGHAELADIMEQIKPERKKKVSVLVVSVSVESRALRGHN